MAGAADATVRNRFFHGGYLDHRYIGICFARTSTVAATQSPTACAIVCAHAAVCDRFRVSPGIDLNTVVVGGGGAAATGAWIAGVAALAATAMRVPACGTASCAGASTGVYSSSYEMSPVRRAGAAGGGCIDVDVGCRTLHGGGGGCGTPHCGGGAGGTAGGDSVTSDHSCGGGVVDDDDFAVVDG